MIFLLTLSAVGKAPAGAKLNARAKGKLRAREPRQQ